MSSFAQLRSQSRALETRTEGLLSRFSSFVQTVSSSATEDEVRLVKEIEECLDKRDETMSSLSRSLESEPAATATKLHQVQRHKEVLQDHKAEFKRIKQSIQHERNRTNLLTSVRTDIENHRRSATNGESEADYMLSERNRIDNAHNLTDRILSQAYETREEFVRQRANLANVQRRVLQTASHIPGLNTLIAKVNTRKKRDSLIIASLITLCILFLFFIR
ncbi:golgi SNAP receptor complex member 1 [Trichomonascus vanleenenianus]|uniref:Gos1p n=1 Tax=Trichomonascus vanleenenianus TaxID=2268995 RepID=UPI003ECAD1CE